jgi:hypothetical protein
VTCQHLRIRIELELLFLNTPRTNLGGLKGDMWAVLGVYWKLLKALL